MTRANQVLLVACVAILGVLLWLVATERSVVPAGTQWESDAPAIADEVTDDEREAPISTFPVMEATTPAEVRAVTRFCRAAQQSDVDALRHAATQSPDPLVVGNALRALGRLGAVAGDAELEALLTDARQRVRQEAVVALGYSGSATAVERLVPLVDENDPMLRPLVLQALGRLGGERARSILKSVLADERSSEAERALAREGLARG